MVHSCGYAAYAPRSLLEPFSFERRDPRDSDVQIDILYCGICHSDLHYVDDPGGARKFPVVPGHEIIGRVTSLGKRVEKFRIGDTVAVGCMIDSCRECDKCHEGREHMCKERPTLTYGGVDRRTGQANYGGYSNNYVVDQDFVLAVPKGLNAAGAAPLLCAGITVYSPLRRWRLGDRHRIGIVGMGGLGHIAIKIARAMGAEVSVFTTSPDKKKDAMAFGAHDVISSAESDRLSAVKGSFDFILDTVSAQHDINLYLDLLKAEGAMCLLGVPPEPQPLAPKAIIVGHKVLIGSNIGGIAETQEMLNFCREHNITAEIELLPLEKVNTAYDRLRKNDVRYRFVIDMSAR